MLAFGLTTRGQKSPCTRARARQGVARKSGNGWTGRHLWVGAIALLCSAIILMPSNVVAQPQTESYEAPNFCVYNEYLNMFLGAVASFAGPALCNTFIHPWNAGCSRSWLDFLPYLGRPCERAGVGEFQAGIENVRRNAWIHMSPEDFLNEIRPIITVAHDVTVQGVDYKVWVGINQDPKNPGGLDPNSGHFWIKPIYQRNCIWIVSAKDYFAPGITFGKWLKDETSPTWWVPEHPADLFKLFQVELCLSFSGGLRADSPSTRLYVPFEARLVGACFCIEAGFAGLYAELVKAEVGLAIPGNIILDITPNVSSGAMEIRTGVEVRKPTQYADFNLLSQRAHLDIPLLLQYMAPVLLSIPCGGCGLDAGPNPGQPVAAEARPTLPTPLVDSPRASEATEDWGNGVTATRLSNIMAVQPGDAQYKYLAASGALDCLGVQPDALAGGAALYLDYADAHTRACTGETGPGNPTLQGLATGFAIALPPCAARSLGPALLVQADACNKDLPIDGYDFRPMDVSPLDSGESWNYDPLAISAGECYRDLCPLAAAKETASQAVRTALDQSRVACIPNPVASGISGHTYTVAEICEMLAYEPRVADGGQWTSEALAHQRDVVVDVTKRGFLVWLEDPCNASPTGPALAELGLCLDVDAVSGPVASKYLQTVDVYQQLQDGLTQISTAGPEIERIHRGEWEFHEPISSAAAAEGGAACKLTPVCGSGGDPVFEVLRAADCAIAATLFGNHC